MSDVELKVSLEEAVAIVNLLGSLPTAQKTHPLWAKLKAQVEPLLPKPEEKAKSEKKEDVKAQAGKAKRPTRRKRKEAPGQKESE